MAFTQSSNPTLSQKIFDRSIDQTNGEVMTVRGSMAKFGFLLLMVIAGAVYTWNLYLQFKITTMMTFMWVGLIGGIVTGLIISFKPTTAKYLAPAYGLLEGFVLGAFSVLVNEMVGQKYPNIVPQAVGLTLCVAFSMFLLYNFRVIKPTQRFKSIIITASAGIFMFYMITLVLSFFGVNIGFMSWSNNSPLAIGINLFVIAIAALSLILDFERIEGGADAGAPKYMEWYGAFGLLVTLVWLYIQILQLLSRFAGSRN